MPASAAHAIGQKDLRSKRCADATAHAAKTKTTRSGATAAARDRKVSTGSARNAAMCFAKRSHGASGTKKRSKLQRRAEIRRNEERERQRAIRLHPR